MVGDLGHNPLTSPPFRRSTFVIRGLFTTPSGQPLNY